VLDPDKLDYLNRDAYFCGVPYGIQDVDFILEELYPDKLKGVALSRKGVTALESILFSKYLMYKTVYWHKTVRIATAMIKKAIATALAEGIIARQELYGLDDDEFFAMFTEKRHPVFRLVGAVRMRRLHKMVYRVPFRTDLPSHLRLERIEERLRLEQDIVAELARKLGRTVSREDVIVDVPERISFEIDVPLIETGERDPAFIGGEAHILGAGAAEHLPRALRYIGVSVCRDTDIMAAIEQLDISRFLA
jgi:HD superfamily phosphohydrolase